MSFKVRLQPDGFQFSVQTRETILDAGLRNGLNLPHNCSNGSCGNCAAQLINGKVTPLRHHDYVFSAEEKRNHSFLPCCYRAESDISICIDRINSPSDIPEQSIDGRLAKATQLNEHIVQLEIRTPRTQHLQFLAGQRARLTFGDCFAIVLPIASCPCDGMHLRFHLFVDDKTEMACLDQQLHHGNRVTVQGPCGNFVLNEHSNRPLLLIAFDFGFAQISSLIDHAISLDPDRDIRLYWIATRDSGHYLSNFCRSWQDSLDNFQYHPIHTDASSDEGLLDLYRQICEQQSVTSTDSYITIPSRLVKQVEDIFFSQDASADNLHIDRIDNPA